MGYGVRGLGFVVWGTGYRVHGKTPFIIHCKAKIKGASASKVVKARGEQCETWALEHLRTWA